MSNNYNYNSCQITIKALIDQIHSLDKSQENHLDSNVLQSNEIQTYSMQRVRAAAQNENDELNDAKVNDVMVYRITTMNDSFNYFEDNDKSLKNNLETNYYGKTEVDNLLDPINENISLATSNIELLTERMNSLQGTTGYFATKEELTSVDNKFANYVTISSLTNTLKPINDSISTKATKEELTSIDNKFANYTKTTDLSKNYALKADSLTKNTLLNIFSITMNGYYKYNPTSINYIEEANKYIKWFYFSNSYIEITFNDIVLSKRFLIEDTYDFS